MGDEPEKNSKPEQDEGAGDGRQSEDLERGAASGEDRAEESDSAPREGQPEEEQDGAKPDDDETARIEGKSESNESDDDEELERLREQINEKHEASLQKDGETADHEELDKSEEWESDSAAKESQSSEANESGADDTPNEMGEGSDAEADNNGAEEQTEKEIGLRGDNSDDTEGVNKPDGGDEDLGQPIERADDAPESSEEPRDSHGDEKELDDQVADDSASATLEPQQGGEREYETNQSKGEENDISNISEEHDRESSTPETTESASSEIDKHLESTAEHDPSGVMDERDDTLAERRGSSNSDEVTETSEEAKSTDDRGDWAEGIEREKEWVGQGEMESEDAQGRVPIGKEPDHNGSELDLEGEKEPILADGLEQPSEQADVEHEVSLEASGSLPQTEKSDADLATPIDPKPQLERETHSEPAESGDEARDILNASDWRDQESASTKTPAEEPSETDLRPSEQLPTGIEEKRLSNEVQRQDIDRNPMVTPETEATELDEERTGRNIDAQDVDTLRSDQGRDSREHELVNLQEISSGPSVFVGERNSASPAQPADSSELDGIQNVATSWQHENIQTAGEPTGGTLDHQALRQTSSPLAEVPDSSQASHLASEATWAKDAIRVDSHGDAQAVSGAAEGIHQNELTSFERHDYSVITINNHTDRKETTFQMDAQGWEPPTSTIRTEQQSTERNHSGLGEHRRNVKLANMSANEGASDGAPNARTTNTRTDNLAQQDMAQTVEKQYETPLLTNGGTTVDKLADRGPNKEAVDKANAQPLLAGHLSEKVAMGVTSENQPRAYEATRNDGQNANRLASVTATAYLRPDGKFVHFGVRLRSIEKQTKTKLESGKLYEIRGRINGSQDFRTLHKAGDNSTIMVTFPKNHSNTIEPGKKHEISVDSIAESKRFGVISRPEPLLTISKRVLESAGIDLGGPRSRDHVIEFEMRKVSRSDNDSERFFGKYSEFNTVSGVLLWVGKRGARGGETYELLRTREFTHGQFARDFNAHGGKETQNVKLGVKGDTLELEVDGKRFRPTECRLTAFHLEAGLSLRFNKKQEVHFWFDGSGIRSVYNEHRILGFKTSEHKLWVTYAGGKSETTTTCLAYTEESKSVDRARLSGEQPTDRVNLLMKPKSLGGIHDYSVCGSKDGSQRLNIPKDAISAKGINVEELSKSSVNIIEVKLRNLSQPEGSFDSYYGPVMPSNGYVSLAMTKRGWKEGDEFEIVALRKYSLKDFIDNFNSKSKDRLNMTLSLANGRLSIDVGGKKYDFSQHRLMAHGGEVVLKARLPDVKNELKFWYDGKDIRARYGNEYGILSFDNSDWGLLLNHGSEGSRTTSHTYFGAKPELQTTLDANQIMERVSLVSKPQELEGDYFFEAAPSLRDYARDRLATETSGYRSRRGKLGEDTLLAVLTLAGWEVVERHPESTAVNRTQTELHGPDCLMREPNQSEAQCWVELKWVRDFRVGIKDGEEQLKREYERTWKDSNQDPNLSGAYIASLVWEPESPRGRVMVKKVKL